MTPRSIRRAAERKALKLARKSERQDPAAPAISAGLELDRKPSDHPAPDHRPEPESTRSLPLSAVRTAANRRNALLSQGPITREGKNISQMNALKTGLTGKTVLLPSDDVAEYRSHVEAFEQEWRPVGQQEQQLVQSLADIAWRIARISGLEFAIYARGQMQFENLFENQDQGARAALIQLETYLVFEKELRNLSLQEARLYRRRDLQTAELRSLQMARKKEELIRAEALARVKQPVLPPPVKVQAAANGFEFSDFLSEAPSPSAAASETRLQGAASMPSVANRSIPPQAA